MRLSEAEYLAILARTGHGLPPETREQQFQAQVVRLAKELGWMVYHTLDSRGSAAGFPDLLLARHDRPTIYAWELKTAQGKVQIAQQVWLAALHGKVIEAQVWRPGGMGEIVAKLKGQG